MLDKILASRNATVEAPAGCGKTELIIAAAKATHGRPLLVLTHTNAGVRALRERMQRRGVSAAAAQVETIASWALRYSCAYPKKSALVTADPTSDDDWNSVYTGTATLLGLPVLQHVIDASYSRVFVDEYQDCSSHQHSLISTLAERLPTCILGDPLQAIFSFRGELPWLTVLERFPLVAELNEPWRWKNGNQRLGEWTLAIRQALKEGNPIQLKGAPIHFDDSNREKAAAQGYRILKLDGSVISIFKMPHEAHYFAKNMRGTYQSMEEMETKDLFKFIESIEGCSGLDVALALINFAADCMTGVSANIKSAVDALEKKKRPDVTRPKKCLLACIALAAVYDAPTPRNIYQALQQIRNHADELYRYDLWFDTLRLFGPDADLTLSPTDRAKQLRDKHRAVGRRIASNAVSRTLLIKGLEFAHAFIPNASCFLEKKRPHDAARHFYVAATRGSRSLTILNDSPTLQFPPAAI
jgi:hypothetical protein